MAVELETTAMELEITAMELEMKKSDPNRGEDRLTECGGGEMGKKGIRRDRGGPPEGWSSKTAPDEPGYEVPSPESDPRAHKGTHALTDGRQAAGEKRRVTMRAGLFSGRVAIDV